MKRSYRSLLLTAVAVLSMGNYAQAASAQVFKPESGGYRLNIPAGAEEIYRTTTGIRFVVGKNQLVNADIYSLPNFIAVPLKQYSAEQKKDLASFINKAQDFTDFTFAPQKALPQVVETRGDKDSGGAKDYTFKKRLEELIASKKGTPSTKAVKPSKKLTPAKEAINPLSMDEHTASFALNAAKDSTLQRNYVVGKAYQLRNDKMLMITIASPHSEKNIAEAGLLALTKDLKLSKPHYPASNTLASELLGAKLELPAGWHAFTLKADNVIMARTLSGVHNDNAMIRAFKTNEFHNFAVAKSEQLAQAEKDFIAKITKFTPNIAIVKHQSVVIDGMNGTIIESTDSDDLKKVFVLNAYLFTPDDIGYQIRFSTDDTINYDLKLAAYTAAIKSFKMLKK